MGRKKGISKVNHIPEFFGFKPVGKNNVKAENVDFYFDEYEAIYYVDYKRMNYDEAAKEMGMSKSAFGRLIIKARNKIATAFAESRGINCVLGEIYSDQMIVECKRCFFKFIVHPETNQVEECPICGCEELEDIVCPNAK
jgi:predicted DNA-binding protein (UPF0251 family)